MKISTVRVGAVDVPLRGSYSTAHGTLTVQRSVVVRVDTDDGLVGWGNVDPAPGYSEMSVEEILQSVVESLAPGLQDLDPLNVTAALQRLEAERPQDNEARALLEMALLDIKGQALGVPVWSLLGGRVRSRIDLNAWIGAVPPADAAREAADWCARGYRSAKVKVGGRLEDDVARVAAARNAVGSRMALRVDANEGLDVDGAIRLARALEPYDLTLLEQPVQRRNLEGLARIRRSTSIPIMADESVRDGPSVIALIQHGAADLIKVKVMKQGGLTRTLQIASIAEAAGIRVVLGHGFGLWISTLAEVHVAAACATIIDGCEAVGPLKMAGDVVTEAPEIASGGIEVPESPGLGVRGDEVRLRTYGWMAGANHGPRARR
jgi:muconate cycloisomerase